MSRVPQFLQAALVYISLGLAVFPVRPGTKVPLTQRGHLDATTELCAVENWWHRWPDAGVGIACRPSGIVVLDQDPRNGGDETLADLQRRHGPLPATWRSLTGGGGLHVIFRAQADTALVDGAIAPGSDLKANGYIVAPPSRHPSGRRYAWECGYEPGALPLAAAPAWLLERNRRRDDRLRFDGTPLVLREGARNTYIFRLAAAFRGYGLNAHAIHACLSIINREHAIPPLPEDEVARIAASAARYSPRSLAHDRSAGEASDEDVLLARALGVRLP